jgi:hypothetical protein
MRRGIMLAWLTGMGLITYRSVHNLKSPPAPGDLILGSGFFLLLTILAEYDPAAPTAALIAWGMDLAGFLTTTNKYTPAQVKSSTVKSIIVGNTKASSGWWGALKPAVNTTIFPNGTASDNAAGSTKTATTGPQPVNAAGPGQPANPICPAGYAYDTATKKCVLSTSRVQ